MPFVTSLADLVDETDLNKPVLTLRGIDNDISVCSDKTCTAEFITFDGVRKVLGTPGIFTSPGFGDTMSGGANAAENYDPANYRPEPRGMNSCCADNADECRGWVAVVADN